MAKLRLNQFTTIPQEHVDGLTVELLSKASASFSSASIYVDINNGNDFNDGSMLYPKRSIQAAVNSLPLIINHPIEIVLAKGIYTETIQFTKHTLGADGFIIIKPSSGAAVVLAGDDKLDHCIVVDFAQGVCVRDITIQGFRKEAVKIVNSAKIDMNRCVLRDNFIALSISNQSSTYELNNCVFLNNSIGVRVFNVANAEIKDSSFELNKVAISVENLSSVSLHSARIASNTLAFESRSRSILDVKDSVVTENTSVAHIDLATLSSRNTSKATLISNNQQGFFATKSATIDLQNVDLINNKQVDIIVDAGSTAILEDCSLRKSTNIFAFSAKKGNQVHLLGETRSRSLSDKLYDPMQDQNFFG